MLCRKKLSADWFREHYSYNPIDGKITKLKKTSKKSNNVGVGKHVGYLRKDGYVEVSICKRGAFLAHRLAALYMTGSMPEVVDHDNHVRDDNTWSNLKISTQKKNSRNRKEQGGIHFHKTQKKFHAHIGVDGQRIHLGSFAKYTDALNARKRAEALYW